MIAALRGSPHAVGVSYHLAGGQLAHIAVNTHTQADKMLLEHEEKMLHLSFCSSSYLPHRSRLNFFLLNRSESTVLCKSLVTQVQGGTYTGTHLGRGESYIPFLAHWKKAKNIFPIHYIPHTHCVFTVVI